MFLNILFNKEDVFLWAQIITYYSSAFHLNVLQFSKYIIFPLASPEGIQINILVLEQI